MEAAGVGDQPRSYPDRTQRADGPRRTSPPETPSQAEGCGLMAWWEGQLKRELQKLPPQEIERIVTGDEGI